MFLMVRGIEHQGATAQLGELLANLAGQGTMRSTVVTTLFAAIGSNVINNVPMIAVMDAAIPGVHGTLHAALVYGTLLGCDLGPNLTVVGSLSTLIWLLLLRKRGLEVSGLAYAKLGIIVTPIMLLASSLLLGVLLQ
jgi:arsenical pump membrane protein